MTKPYKYRVYLGIAELGEGTPLMTDTKGEYWWHNKRYTKGMPAAFRTRAEALYVAYALKGNGVLNTIKLEVL